MKRYEFIQVKNGVLQDGTNGTPDTRVDFLMEEKPKKKKRRRVRGTYNRRDMRAIH